MLMVILTKKGGKGKIIIARRDYMYCVLNRMSKKKLKMKYGVVKR